jgi:peptidoglycan/xylan/chitin deacetylase (PgdA/CDA1 family)
LRDAIVVFLYHDVEDAPSPFNQMFDLAVTPSTFREQLELIGEHFHFIGPDELVTGDHPTPAALVTFDDGNVGYVRHAVPILKEKGIPSVCFVNMGPAQGDLCSAGLGAFLEYVEPGPSGRIGEEGGHFTTFGESELSRRVAAISDVDAFRERVRAFRGGVATKADLDALSSEPFVYLGSHLYNHYNAGKLSEERLKEEYWKNQRLLDAHPRGTRLFSYPFGQPRMSYNDRTTRVLHEQGAFVIFSAYALPNFTRRGPFYHRVAMHEAVRTRDELFRAIVKNYLRIRCGFGPTRMC